MSVRNAATNSSGRRRSVEIYGQYAENPPSERWNDHLKSKKDRINDQDHAMIVVKSWKYNALTSDFGGYIASVAGEFVLESLESDFAEGIQFASAGRKIDYIDYPAKKLAKNPEFRKQSIEALDYSLETGEPVPKPAVNLFERDLVFIVLLEDILLDKTSQAAERCLNSA